jgi:UDP-glucose 4-epimerase
MLTRHLVHLSSLGAYSPGPVTRPVTEDWPSGGIETLAYSREKVAAERLLDEHQRRLPGGTAVARMRPGLIVQRDAGSSLLRYGMPAYLPAGLLRHIPLLPLDRDLAVPLVHTDDSPMRWRACCGNRRPVLSTWPPTRR